MPPLLFLQDFRNRLVFEIILKKRPVFQKLFRKSPETEILLKICPVSSTLMLLPLLSSTSSVTCGKPVRYLWQKALEVTCVFILKTAQL